MIEPWQVHTVVFDLDDTLFAERDFVFSGFKAVDTWLVQQHGVHGFQELAEHLFGAGRRGRIFDEALVSLGHTEVPWVSQMLAVYREHLPAIVLSAEARDILDWSAERFRLALVSDGYLEVQRRKAAALGLSRWIDCQVFSDQWGREAWKPSERPFREVMARCPGKPNGFVYVGDNPRKDFIGARTLGWRTVRVRHNQGEHSSYEPSAAEAAEIEIPDLSALSVLLTPAFPRS